MPAKGYYDVVRERIEQQQPDLAHLLTYRQIMEKYGERFRALGFKVNSGTDVASSLRALTSRRVLHRYEQGGDIKIPQNEIETYLNVLEEPRPVA